MLKCFNHQGTREAQSAEGKIHSQLPEMSDGDWG
jgi:hypothetical protein